MRGLYAPSGGAVSRYNLHSNIRLQRVSCSPSAVRKLHHRNTCYLNTLSMWNAHTQAKHRVRADSHYAPAPEVEYCPTTAKLSRAESGGALATLSVHTSTAGGSHNGDLTGTSAGHRRDNSGGGSHGHGPHEPEEPSSNYPIIAEAFGRGRWLLGLLILQSTSSFVLDAHAELLREHLVVTLFLTMLVGAGGNAGNQSAIKVIRGLATGSIKPSWQSAKNTLAEQSLVGLMLGTGLSMGGFLRVYVTNGDVMNATAISLSLFMIVMTSVVMGTGLPFALARAGLDPANAGTTIQVVMDILGVGITCTTCHLLLVQLAQGLPQ